MCPQKIFFRRRLKPKLGLYIFRNNSLPLKYPTNETGIMHRGDVQRAADVNGTPTMDAFPVGTDKRVCLKRSSRELHAGSLVSLPHEGLEGKRVTATAGIELRKFSKN